MNKIAIELDKKSFQPVSGHSWRTSVFELGLIGESTQSSQLSTVILLEDGVPLGPGSSSHEEISKLGHGRYSHWETDLIFSSRDNSNPISNEKQYTLIPLEQLFKDRSLSEAIIQTINLATVDSSQSCRKNKYREFSQFEQLTEILMPGYLLADWSRSYTKDERLLQLYYQFENNGFSYDRKYNLYQLIRQTIGLEGDIVECGVYQGCTAAFLATARDDFSINCMLHLVDSYEGLSEPVECDGDFWSKGDMKTSLYEVQDRLSGFLNVNYLKGWIPDVLKPLNSSRFRFAHIDVDLYTPTLTAIYFLYSRMTKGGLFVFDDYGFETCKGAKAAIDEYFSDKPEQIIPLSSGQCFIIKK